MYILLYLPPIELSPLHQPSKMWRRAAIEKVGACHHRSAVRRTDWTPPVAAIGRRPPPRSSCRRILSTSAAPFSPKEDANTAERVTEHLQQLAMEHPKALQRWVGEHLTTQHRNSIAQLKNHLITSHVPGEPPKSELRKVMLNTAIPFVGFGIMDNAILIVAGDAIDTSLGVTLGISTMCAAAIGNIISDVAGIGLGTLIEDACAKYLNLPQPVLTTSQRQLRSVRYANQLGCGIGIVIGCIIGMFPLFFIDSNKIQAYKREVAMESIFADVVTEAGSLIGAQGTALFLLVNKPTSDAKGKKKNTASPKPNPQGKYLYAKFDANLSATGQPHVERLFPLGRGIISRAALTGEAWNIYDVRSEPDYMPEMGESSSMPIRNMMCVPVLDGQGRAIAVIQAVNKIGRGSYESQLAAAEADNNAGPQRFFTNSDVQIIKALASHISVSLQRMYDSADHDAELRLKDTIQMLKDYGLAGITEDRSIRQKLFPED